MLSDVFRSRIGHAVRACNDTEQPVASLIVCTLLSEIAVLILRCGDFTQSNYFYHADIIFNLIYSNIFCVDLFDSHSFIHSFYWTLI